VRYTAGVNDVAIVVPADDGAVRAGWDARLALSFARRDGRTVLEHRAHCGPLRVQKPFYPEGDAVCQTIVVHPPGGIVGGDRLALDVRVGEKAYAQLTTPGAAKWYRSAGAPARQHLHFSVAGGALLEWLPHESIVFDGAMPVFETEIELHGDATFFGWDIVCLGRRLSGESWSRGRLEAALVLRRDGATAWIERGRFDGGSRLAASRVGLDHSTVYGTFLASAARMPDDLVARCRAVECGEGEVAVTRLPGVLIGRYRGESAQAARTFFAGLWSCARPALTGREAVPPRIWNT
jgi:urease accessory protein